METGVGGGERKEREKRRKKTVQVPDVHGKIGLCGDPVLCTMNIQQ